MRGLHDIMLLSEKLKDTANLAKQADQRSIEVSERLARVEALLDYALHGAAQEIQAGRASKPRSGLISSLAFGWRGPNPYHRECSR